MSFSEYLELIFTRCQFVNPPEVIFVPPILFGIFKHGAHPTLTLMIRFSSVSGGLPVHAANLHLSSATCSVIPISLVFNLHL